MIEKIKKNEGKENTSFRTTSEFSRFKGLYLELKEKYGASIYELAGELEKKEVLVPSSILNQELTILQTLCKYLKENLDYNFASISKLINRNPRIIWKAYHLAKKILPEEFVVKDPMVNIPISIFSNREMSATENIVVYLKEKTGMKYSEIAKIMNRDERTVWTAYNRAKVKRNEK
jgi:hypothetical protein